MQGRNEPVSALIHRLQLTSRGIEATATPEVKRDTQMVHILFQRSCEQQVEE